MNILFHHKFLLLSILTLLHSVSPYPLGIEYSDTLRVVENRNLLFPSLKVKGTKLSADCNFVVYGDGSVVQKNGVCPCTIYRIPDVFEVSDGELLRKFKCMGWIRVVEQDVGTGLDVQKMKEMIEAEMEKLKKKDDNKDKSDDIKVNNNDGKAENEKNDDNKDKSDDGKAKNDKNEKNDDDIIKNDDGQAKNDKNGKNDDGQAKNDKKGKNDDGQAKNDKNGKNDDDQAKNDKNAKNDDGQAKNDKKGKNDDGQAKNDKNEKNDDGQAKNDKNEKNDDGKKEKIIPTEDISNNSTNTFTDTKKEFSYIYLDNLETPFLRESLSYIFLKNIDCIKNNRVVVSQRDYIQNPSNSEKIASSFMVLDGIKVKYIVPESVCISAELFQKPDTGQTRRYTIMNSNGHKSVISTFLCVRDDPSTSNKINIINEDVYVIDDISDYKINGFIMKWLKNTILNNYKSKVNGKSIENARFYPDFDMNGDTGLEIKSVDSHAEKKEKSIYPKNSSAEYLYCDLTDIFKEIRSEFISEIVILDEILEIIFYNEKGESVIVMHDVYLDIEKLHEDIKTYVNESSKNIVAPRKYINCAKNGIFSKLIFKKWASRFEVQEDFIASGAARLNDDIYVIKDKRIYDARKKYTNKKDLEENIQNIKDEINIKKKFENLKNQKIDFEYVKDLGKKENLMKMVDQFNNTQDLKSKKEFVKLYEALKNENAKNKHNAFMIEKYKKMIEDTLNEYKNVVKEWNNKSILDLFENTKTWFENIKNKDNVDVPKEKHDDIHYTVLQEKYLDISSTFEAHKNKLLKEKLDYEKKILEEKRKEKEEKKKNNENETSPDNKEKNKGFNEAIKNMLKTETLKDAIKEEEEAKKIDEVIKEKEESIHPEIKDEMPMEPEKSREFL